MKVGSNLGRLKERRGRVREGEFTEENYGVKNVKGKGR